MESRVHDRVWERAAVEEKPWKPVATYGLLGAMASVYLLQQMSLSNPALHNFIFTVDVTWLSRPWSLITSTFAHDPTRVFHLLINGLMLYFFGPQLERLMGRRNFVALFLISGAISGVLQAELSAAWGQGWPALGASGALMFMFATLVVLFPNNTLLLYGIIPLKFWIAGILFATLDVLGAFNTSDGIGNFAHLGGALLGLAFGFGLRRNPAMGLFRVRRVYPG